MFIKCLLNAATPKPYKLDEEEEVECTTDDIACNIQVNHFFFFSVRDLAKKAKNLCGKNQNLPCNAQTAQIEQSQGYAGMAESAMDIEMVKALAPKAQILFYDATNNEGGAIAMYNQIATEHNGHSGPAVGPGR